MMEVVTIAAAQASVDGPPLDASTHTLLVTP
jgi:hypothetical protein